jgi:large subunit ribosomal protein L7/L12
MATLTNDEIIEAIKAKSLIEISELVKQFEETFGVSAAAPVAVAPGGGGGAAAEEAPAEQEEFDVILEAAGDKKSLGLKEAKDLVDGAPKAVVEKGTKEAAEKAKEALEGAGASVTVK